MLRSLTSVRYNFVSHRRTPACLSSDERHPAASAEAGFIPFRATSSPLYSPQLQPVFEPQP